MVDLFGERFDCGIVKDVYAALKALAITWAKWWTQRSQIAPQCAECTYCNKSQLAGH